MIDLVRRIKPLILCITNDVVKTDTANGLLALGASPIMSNEKKELKDIIQHAGGVLLNIGTASEEKIELYKKAAQYANEFKVPLVLDPVGYGASSFRKNLVDQLLESYEFSLVKGNASEMLALSGQMSQSKGVDSVETEKTSDIAKLVFQELKVPVLVTGEIDSYVDHEEQFIMKNGHFYQATITGSGCILGSFCAAFLAVDQSYEAVVKAISLYNIAAEKGAHLSGGPSQFRSQLIDEIYNFKENDFERKAVETFE